MPKLQFGKDHYRIVGNNGEEGELVEYGEAAELRVGLSRYLAIVDLDADDEEEVVSLLPGDAWMEDRGETVTCEHEDVLFEGIEEQEGEEGEGGESEQEGETEAAASDEEEDGEDDEEDEEDDGVEPDTGEIDIEEDE